MILGPDQESPARLLYAVITLPKRLTQLTTFDKSFNYLQSAEVAQEAWCD